jgi:hypothetical protein
MPLPPNRENSRAGALPLFVARVRQIVHKVIKDVEIKRLARDVAWSSFGVALSQVITLVAYIVLARYIGKERFGEFTIIQGTANTVSAFAGLSRAEMTRPAPATAMAKNI